MITIKIDEDLTPELREAIVSLIENYNVVSFVVGRDTEAASGPKSGATGKDLSSAVSDAVSKAEKNAKLNS